MNAHPGDMLAALSNAFDAPTRDEGTRVVILSGAART
jgi:enoyl-CoA hydratase/carnithine racemase